MALTYADYVLMGKTKHLEPMFSHTPSGESERVLWKCTLCGRVNTKYYKQLRDGGVGCVCQRKYAVGLEDYHWIAEKYRLKWVGVQLPSNILEDTEWQRVDGSIVVTNYKTLRFRMTRRMAKKLGVFYVDPSTL